MTSAEDDTFFHAFFQGLRNWEHSSLDLWRMKSARSRLVLDVGAYTGVYSLVASLSGAERVLAYEPNPFIHKYLTRNLAVNPLASRHVEVRTKAVGSVPAALSMLAPLGRPTSSGIQLANADTQRDLSKWHRVGIVDVVRLDDELTPEQTSDLDLVKIDAEGSEMGVIDGFEQGLRGSQPTLVIECLSASQLAEVTARLSGWGYKSASWIGPTGAVPAEAVQWGGAGHYKNFLFEAR